MDCTLISTIIATKGILEQEVRISKSLDIKGRTTNSERLKMASLKTIVFLSACLIQAVVGFHNNEISNDEQGPIEIQPVVGSFESSESFQLESERDNPDNIRFYLFPNPMNPYEKEEIMFGNASSLANTQFKKNVETKFIVHGFIQNLDAEFPQNVKNAYLKRMRRTGESWNIVVVDWGKLAYQIKDGFPFYTRAVKNVEPTGVRIAQFISFLIDNGLLKGVDQVHLIGQSLGAHVVGKCGDSLHNKYNKRVARITGSDPAGPLFYTSIVSRRLETWDGEYVDVYHCNPGGYGIRKSVGDIEFYPNPKVVGRIQPQCMKIREKLESPDMCSHNYCPKFFALSINKPILARKCLNAGFFKMGDVPFGCSSKTAVYGEDVSKLDRGKYFVNIPDNLDDMNLFL